MERHQVSAVTLVRLKDDIATLNPKYFFEKKGQKTCGAFVDA